MTNGNREAASAPRRKKNLKCWSYIVCGIILQTLIILVFVLTIMRIRNLKVRLGSVTVENLSINSSTTSSSFSMRLNAQVTIKNTNFGHYKFQNSTATISYRGTPVGDAVIAEERVRARSTKKLNITATATSDLSGDINSGKIMLSTYGRLNGKIYLLKVIKKKKSAEMNCTMDVSIRTKEIENLQCK